MLWLVDRMPEKNEELVEELSEELWLGASWTMGVRTGQRGMGQRQSTH